MQAAVIKPLKQPDLLPVENPSLCAIQEDGNDDGSGEAERTTLPYSLLQSSKGTAGFVQAVVKILADCGIIGNDATQVSKMLHCVEVGAI